jgi:2-hydroxy-3-keto-5-methylthiopentenyl-1-phosphate phosphatase
LLSTTIFCDFDGTITEVDTAEIIVDKFSTEDWRKEDQLFVEGKISLEECIQRQFGPLRATVDEMVSAVDYIQVRRGFKELVDFTRRATIGFVVVSAGLDFVIKKKLEGIGVGVKVISPEAKSTPNGLRVTFPKIEGHGADFKAKLLNNAKAKGERVYYIGDGESDYSAALEADFIYAVKDSRLANFCGNKNLAFKEFADFTEIVSSLKELEHQDAQQKEP